MTEYLLCVIQFWERERDQAISELIIDTSDDVDAMTKSSEA